ncbi:MAG TPA: helix-turn-helix domain-containing protein [Blastocatellia bacterium]|nr:helix-turn-helix domain-containing protein [Blastocatellia bacterium]
MEAEEVSKDARAPKEPTMKARMEALVREMVERGILFEDAVEEFEKHFILAVLERKNGNLSKASEELRIHRNTLSRRVEKYFQNGHMKGARLRRARPRKPQPKKAAARARR